MMVALPSAIAFGVTIFSSMGSSYAAQGALAGILGVTALGLLAPLFGGTNRLITAPCAPAAAVLSAFAIEFIHQGNSVESTLLMISMLGLAAGILQLIFGTVGLGRLIKYMPYSVVSGYLSGVGLYIIASQVPKLLGAPKGMHFWASLAAMGMWKWQAILVGSVTIAVMYGASKVIKVVPAAILALLAGVVAYFGVALLDNSLFTLTDNTLVVGSLGKSGASFTEAMSGRLRAASNLQLHDVRVMLFPALTLAALLSIDTLKTCVVLDALTRSRHDSNRELRGQGIGNVVSAIIGGIPGAGAMGPTLVNMSGGASTRLSGVVEGALALVAFVLLGSVIAWVPVAALAGILIVIGLRMIDMHNLTLLKSESTRLDFLVIISVVIVALSVSLIAASGVGVLLAIALFVHEEVGNKIMRRKSYGNETFSKQIRVQEEMEVLSKQGGQAVIFELQGSLFFGTADQLYTLLEPEIKLRTYVILDMRRVQTVDMTAAHMLEQIKDMLNERKGYLLFSNMPASLPSGRDMKQYFRHLGLTREGNPVLIFGELDEAVEWVEDRIIAQALLQHEEESLLELNEFELFKGRKLETLASLAACMTKLSYKAGELIFESGTTGDELFLIRRGEVRILLPLDETHNHHISTFGRGSFFGEMSFLDGQPRSATAIAQTDTDIYGLSRAEFEKLAEEHKKVAISLLVGLSRVLAARLRYANTEIHALDS